MNIVFVAPRSAWRQALAAETRAAAADGHQVRLIAEDGPGWEEHPLDERVEIRWIGARDVQVPEPKAIEIFLRRIPLGLLRRLGRGPLRGPADRVAGKWRRAVLGPLKRRRLPGTEALRERHRIDRVGEALAEWRPDWIVLHEPQAVELGVHWLPGLLDARADLRTTFSYEPRAEANATHAG